MAHNNEMRRAIYNTLRHMGYPSDVSRSLRGSEGKRLHRFIKRHKPEFYDD